MAVYTLDSPLHRSAGSLCTHANRSLPSPLCNVRVVTASRQLKFRRDSKDLPNAFVQKKNLRSNSAASNRHSMPVLGLELFGRREEININDGIPRESMAFLRRPTFRSLPNVRAQSSIKHDDIPNFKCVRKLKTLGVWTYVQNTATLEGVVVVLLWKGSPITYQRG
ncbi:hypothetical protein FA15DRAFT_668857 [Coprinopsis marcescibilis]|uniref:Uncharacterized protein n=1 Tax=Coprinopsis marcescibilis TaxID=230819 RepID=A0A5C3KXM3_COPMA|nr:hypothetical protein FA15DRAFT_668857 [Coprinopsis marcescibilis]